MYKRRAVNPQSRAVRIGAIVFSLTAATLAAPALAQEPDQTDAATIALIETIISSAGVLVDATGCHTEASLNYSGLITPGEGWLAQLQGSWGETPLTLNYIATPVDAFSFNVNGGGSLGSLPWLVDTAQASFANTPPEIRQIGLGDARIQFMFLNPDWHWWKRFIRLPDGTVIDWGAFTVTRDGKPQMTYVQRSYSAPRVPGQPAPHSIYATADWQSGCEFRLEGNTFQDESHAGVAGTISLNAPARQPPCSGGIFSRVVGTTTECQNHQIIWVNTLEWYCPPDYHVETSVERVVTDTPC